MAEGLRDALVSRNSATTVQNIPFENPIMWHYLRDPMFNRFYTTQECDRHTHTEMDGQIHDDGMYCVSTVSYTHLTLPTILRV